MTFFLYIIPMFSSRNTTTLITCMRILAAMLCTLCVYPAQGMSLSCQMSTCAEDCCVDRPETPTCCDVEKQPTSPVKQSDCSCTFENSSDAHYLSMKVPLKVEAPFFRGMACMVSIEPPPVSAKYALPLVLIPPSGSHLARLCCFLL